MIYFCFKFWIKCFLSLMGFEMRSLSETERNLLSAHLFKFFFYKCTNLLYSTKGDHFVVSNQIDLIMKKFLFSKKKIFNSTKTRKSLKPNKEIFLFCFLE